MTTDDMRPTIKSMLLRWKVMVFYGKMKYREYLARKAALDELMRRMGAATVRPVGWVALRKLLRRKDPTLYIPPDIRKVVYRGKH